MTTFYYVNTSLSSISYRNLVTPYLNDLPEGGQFYSNISRAFVYDSFIPRDGIWTTPWSTAVVDEHIMPAYDATFNKTFSDITDARAIEIGKILETTDKKMAVFYSGGIDSTTCVSALIKNLTEDQLSKISIAMSADSVIENPIFYKDFIQGKITTIDSMKFTYSDLVELNYICVSADIGDALFGTELGTKMYPQFKHLSNNMTADVRKQFETIYYDISNSEVHYSRYKELIIEYFNRLLKNGTDTTIIDNTFGELYYEKLDLNVRTSSVPIHSLHDFYWWIIFNIKYLHCALRPGLIYSKGKNRKQVFGQNLINWFGNADYQLWSMVNNNNGQKIRGTTQGTYKYAAREYIYDLDKNDWYYHNKIKIGSMPFIVARNYKKYFNDFDRVFGLQDNYDVAFIGEPETDKLILDGITNFKIDW